jgi:hypothetical protein
MKTGVKTSIEISYNSNVHEIRDAKKFQKSSSHNKFLGARRVRWNVLQAEDPQILRATVQYLVATATWRPGFVHLCLRRRTVGNIILVSWLNHYPFKA